MDYHMFLHQFLCQFGPTYFHPFAHNHPHEIPYRPAYEKGGDHDDGGIQELFRDTVFFQTEPVKEPMDVRKEPLCHFVGRNDIGGKHNQNVKTCT